MRLLVFAGVAFGLLLVCQINAPALLHRTATPCQEQAALAACVVMGPKKVRVANARNQGFTLIELSIVLVIIGLIVGGVFVGQDLINAAKVRSQIAQIEKFNVAVNTFQSKFGGLPGDISDPNATAFGFAARGTCAAQGDGNGLLAGMRSCGSYVNIWQGGGETAMFWVDLSTANLIEGSFSTASSTVMPASITGSLLDAYFPRAKLGGGNYIFVYSINGINYYDIAVPGQTCPNCIRSGSSITQPGISPLQANNIDAKIDDGLPQTGNVQAWMIYNVVINRPGGVSPYYWGTTDQSATPGSTLTCYDNGNTAGAAQKYSVAPNGGNNTTCTLSFAFQ